MLTLVDKPRVKIYLQLGKYRSSTAENYNPQRLGDSLYQVDDVQIQTIFKLNA